MLLWPITTTLLDNGLCEHALVTTLGSWGCQAMYKLYLKFTGVKQAFMFSWARVLVYHLWLAGSILFTDSLRLGKWILSFMEICLHKIAKIQTLKIVYKSIWAVGSSDLNIFWRKQQIPVPVLAMFIHFKILVWLNDLPKSIC